MKRPGWDETCMAFADTMALRSKCVRRGVGAVIVDTHYRIVATGYNGPPADYPEANVDGRELCNNWCKRAISGDTGLDYSRCPSVHAELNALIWADRSRMERGTLYVSSAMCGDCAKVVANSGVARVVMRVENRDSHRNPEESIEFLRTCGIEVCVVK